MFSTAEAHVVIEETQLSPLGESGSASASTVVIESLTLSEFLFPHL